MNIVINARFGVRKTGIGRVIESLLMNIASKDSANNYYIYVNKEFVNQFNFKNDNFKVISNGVSAHDMILNHIWTQIGMYKALKLHKADLLILPGITLFWRKVVPTILFQHDLIEYYIPNQKWYKLLFRKLTFPIALRLADKIVCVSNNTLDDVMKIFKINDKKLELIYNGVDYGMFKNTNKKDSKLFLKEKYGVNNDYLLYVGTLTQPQKNIVRLIQAFSKLKLEGCNEKLLLVGNKGKDSHLILNEIEKIELTNEIIIIGYVEDSDLKYFYSGADLFVFPSMYEGFGLPVLEAMTCGCPCLTSENSSLGEIAKDAAILVNPESIESIYLGLKKFYDEPNLKEQLIINGKKKSLYFNWDTSGDKFLKLINSFSK